MTVAKLHYLNSGSGMV